MCRPSPPKSALLKQILATKPLSNVYRTAALGLAAMVMIYLISFAAIFVAFAYSKVRTWRKNFRLAQTADFPTFYSPVFVMDIWWMMMSSLFIPLVKCLPRSMQNPWLPLSQISEIWRFGYEPFRDAGSDTFLLVTPTKNVMWTSDPEIIKQLYTRHTVQSPVDLFRFWDIWGPSVQSVEGEEWKYHRKIVTYGLNPSLLPAVWKERIHQTNTLIAKWAECDLVVPVVRDGTSRLALHVISGVFFGRSMDWREYSTDNAASTGGYQLSFQSALLTVLKGINLILTVPRPLLALLPINACKETYTAFIDLTKYLQDMRTKTLSNIDELSTQSRKTILENIVLAGSDHPSQTDSQSLSEESVLANIFFMLLAGHETTASTIGFAVLLLAIYPEPSEHWTSESDFHTLNNGYLGAVIKEVLRNYNIAEFTLRVTVAPTTLVDAKGTSHVVPPNTTCLINVAASLQNPNIWKPSDVSPARRAELHNSQAIDFDPTRWLGKSEEMDGYFPFGYGYRKCPGKPFAQVEMIAFLSTLLKEYTVELVVDEATLKSCGGDKKAAWQMKQDAAIRQMQDDIEVKVSIQMLKELPIRLVRRSV